MLYLTRKIGESVVINDDIEVTVVDIRGKSIKLGFTFPSDASVLRREIHERIQAENRAAAEGVEAIAEALGGKTPESNGYDGEPPSGGDPPGDGDSRGED
ncbi:carbon storage regulator CsrA [Ferruginivarius sediminum]|uniref:Translational regulator CsrA n=1 Tax=Ferruginivarius sediminum TaxID=2661937 RepID=A0A369T695_9PROT|nr:carbon storage regulator CsrA [Ferruginivarius sediminum]RDD60840.1 carbon storage regulator [Ferruginivarius sediminum]